MFQLNIQQYLDVFFGFLHTFSLFKNTTIHDKVHILINKVDPSIKIYFPEVPREDPKKNVGVMLVNQGAHQSSQRCV
jgi:hypothetical protein